MALVLHTATNVGNWQNSDLAALDEAMVRNGSHAVNFSWDCIEMDDPDHFTETGARDFADRLVSNVMPFLSRYDRTTLHVLSDSTIDYNNWNYDTWVRHYRASTYISTRFREHGIHTTVDAINGSGFVAQAHQGKHFHARLSNFLCSHHPPPHKTAILFIGGWNDITSSHPLQRILDAARECVSLAMRGIRTTRRPSEALAPSQTSPSAVNRPRP
jgi:hypothetical protein